MQEKKIIKLGSKVIVTVGGYTKEIENCSDDLLNKLIKAENEDDIKRLLSPNYDKYLDDLSEYYILEDRLRNSNILICKHSSIYWPSVSMISMPQDLAIKILEAEENNNKLLITTYKNFWTLMCLNPNIECIKNLFRFLFKYGLTIAKCGFFVGYRNVFKTDTEEVYTDGYTKTFKIKVGEVVVQDRDKCDSNQEVECSKGLHVAGASWLKNNYFGDTAMAVLVNPADVVAVPFKHSNYGKLRTCAYLPIAKVKFDSKGDLIPLEVTDGFDCSYVTKVIYEGIMGTDDDSPYKINIPQCPELDEFVINDRLLEIAKDCIINKQL